MSFKRSVQKYLKDATKKILIAFILAIVGGLVLGLMLKPAKVEAQVYEPQIQEADTQNMGGANVVGQNANQQNNTPKRTCDKSLPAEIYKQENAVIKLTTGDPGSNRTQEADASLVDHLLVAKNLIGPIDECKVDKTSAYWQRVYSMVPPIRKDGLLGITVKTSAMAMGVNPVPMQEAEVVYAYNFIPTSVRNALNLNVEAGALDVLGSPPSSENAFSILRPIIGGWWLAIFKLSTGIFVLVLIGAGIMIIMRQKVGQNTVTIYMAIKNLVIGYVGAFASFGLGAFFFNFSKWLMVIIARLIWSAWPAGFSKHVYFLDGVPQLTWYFSIKTFGAYVTNIIHNMFAGFSHSLWSILKGPLVMVGTVLAAVPGLVIQIVISGYAFVVFAKILIKVIKIYTNMLIDIILAPLIFLMGAIPGNENTIKEWFTRMLKASIKVPLMFFIVNLGMMFAAIPHLTLKFISGGVLNSGTADWFWTGLNLTILIPITIISTANGVDGLIDQMWGGPSKSGAALAQGAQQILKGMPVIGGAMQ